MREKVVTLKHVSECGREAYQKALMADKDRENLQRRVDAGELESIEGDKSEALPFELVEPYMRFMNDS